jgi:concanavalin A-like lectin/glucanase superfamily protein/galactose oxidase-like protein/Big-like domain-containing protein/purple acid phosphatase-like protein
MDEIISTTTQVHTLLDNALGPKQYWGVFNIILHSDWGDHTRLNELVGEARDRGVPIVTSAQMLSWLDSRNGSSFGNIAYNGNQMTFTLSAHSGARGLRAMLPARSATGPLSKLTRGGQPVSWNKRTVKGVDYVMFDAAGGAYTATYANDTSAPEITAIGATADAEGHATVRWTTDEPSSSIVQYGRTTALGSEVEDTAEVTDHSVELTGLQPSTTYRFKVTSGDSAGNSATAPGTAASFSTPASTLVDSRTAEFALGTRSGTYVGDTLVGPDGEVQLQPVVGEEFNGAALPAGWSSKAWKPGGGVSIVGGSLFSNGGVAHTVDHYSGPRTLEFSATFDAVNDQAIGLGGDTSNYPYAIFSSGMPGDAFGIYAISGASPGEEAHSARLNVSLYVPHRFRIEWTTSAVRYYVDGALVATHNVAIDQEMRPVASDYNLFGVSAKVHWMRMSSYPTSGTFTSRTLDSGPGANDWQNLTFQSVPASGTSISFQTRSGDTRQPNANWSAWQNVGAGGAIASPNSRYLQYRATLQGGTLVTPTLQRVLVSYGAGTDQAPVAGSVSLAPTSPRTNQTLTATVSGFSDPDGDPLTYQYEWFRNGTQIAGATTATLNLSQPGNGDLGDRIRVEVYATDGKGAASDAASAKVTVANTAPTAGTVTTRPVPAATKDLMRAIPSGYADIDGDTLTYQYQWLVNGTAVPGATGATFDVTGHVALNDRVDVDVSAGDGHGGTSPVARGGQVITSTNATPLDGTVTITPAAPKTNQLLTANTSGFHDPDGDALTYHYVWSRNGAPIAGATASTLDLSQAGHGDRGDTIKVDVHVTDPQNHASDGVSANTTVATTDPTAGTVAVKPAAPAVSDTVSATVNGFADVDGDALSYQYQWAVDGSELGGATGRSLNLKTVEGIAVGDVLTVTARALDGHGGTSPTSQGQVTVAAGNGHPVASYGFEEAAGAIAVDQHNGNDGTITGAERANNGYFGRALSFEGNDNIVTVPEDSSLHLGTGMTLEAWVKPTATTNWRTVIFKEASGGPAFSLYSNSPEGDVPHAHIGNDGTSGASGTSELDPSVWTHLAATYDGNLLRLYVDGVLAGSKAIEGELSEAPGPMTFGANNVWGEHFRGEIDEVRVYNRRLTRDEIVADMGAPVVEGTPRPPTDTDPETIGKFAAPVQYPITPVHLALLSNGKVAMWDGFEAALNSEHTWDPWTGEFDAIPTGRNLFCAGHITLTDGRLLSAGGHIQAYEGTKDLNLFDPKVATWTRGPDMSQARWYPTATALPDGRVFVASGDTITLGPNPDPNTPVPLINYSDTVPEIYNPATNAWTSMPSAARKMPLYPYLFVLPNGKLFDAGPDRMTRTLDLQTGQWSNVGMSQIDGQSAVMYRPGKILKSGTWSDPEFMDREATNRATAIDMTAANPTWVEQAPMRYRRSYHTLTVLPDGKVLATGGQNGTDGVDETTGVLPVEMWDPDTNTWTTMASARRPRLYHSSALLMPDGRVLLAGGGAYGLANNEKSGELYSPPYLFKGPRPNVTAAPDQVHYGQSFTVDTPDASRIQKVSFVRMGSVTHNVDMDQRFMNLSMTAGSDSVSINGPANANLAPPGFYMVFLIDDQGVPSMGQIVQLEPNGDTQPPTAPANLAATAQPAGADLSWTASTDNKAVSEYRVFRSTSAGFTPTASNRIARVKTGTTYADRGVATGTHFYKVRAVDKAGNLSPVSNEVSAVIAGDGTAPTVSITAPTGGNVSNTTNLTATAADNVGVQSVQFRLDGQDLGSPDTTAPYTMAWNTTTTTDGSHALTAVARDASGNATTSATRTVGVHNTGLVAAYAFEEASGNSAVDTSNGFNGTISGATRVTAGRFGKALSFDGTNDWVTVADRAELDLLNGGTLEAWVRPSALASWRAVLVKEMTGGWPWALHASSDAGVPSAHLFSGASVDAFGPAPVGLSDWTHLAMTWDNAVLRLYVDGAEVATQPATAALTASAGSVRIGGNSVSSQFFSGLIDEVRIYNDARTPAEIAADMNAPIVP